MRTMQGCNLKTLITKLSICVNVSYSLFTFYPFFYDGNVGTFVFSFFSKKKKHLTAYHQIPGMIYKNKKPSLPCEMMLYCL